MANASLSAAVLRQQALDNLRVPTLLARDLPTRRQQAALGVVIAQASLQQAEFNTLYDLSHFYSPCGATSSSSSCRPSESRTERFQIHAEATDE